MKKILIVDDEKLLPIALGLALKRQGHYVDSVSSAEFARPLTGNCYDMIIADYGLPGLNGVELLKIVRDVAPNTIRLLMTGSDCDFEEHEDLIHLILRKPFGADELDAIMELLQ